MAHFKLLPEKKDAAIQAYNAIGVPRVRAFAGNLDCYLLEPVAAEEEFLACTLWESEAAALAYESGGAAKEVADLIRGAFAGPPRLKTFRATRG